jgi:leucyl-tRNA synthetase
MAKYPFDTIEPKWQQYWAEHNTFAASEDPAFPRDRRRYVLDMFPYPSSQGLHIGHPEGYTATDIYCRYLRMNGYNVLHPMGYDAFGLPAENYAIKAGTHPAITTASNIERFRSQIKTLGFSYDWDREVDTSNEGYYRWTQCIFLKLFERGLAYEAESPINWCPSCKTGLANEEVKDGLCERCGAKVTRKRIRQWILKITAYADRLLADLDGLDWPEPIKLMQRNWIGRSEGANAVFKVDTSALGIAEDLAIEVYTTRPDTLFGATYMVLSPEHPLVEKITTPEQKDAVTNYVESAARKSDLERTDLAKEKTGVFSGAYAINPVNDKKIPIWIADYVLISYGTGAIMAVPAHDERDWEFAKTFGLPIVQVVARRGMGNGDQGLGKEKDGDKDIQGSDSLARSDESCRDDISANEKFSERGNVRPDQPNQEGGCINSCQHSGGQRADEPQRVSSISVDSERLNDGTGNTSADSGTAQISGKRNSGAITIAASVSRTPADCLGKIAAPLTSTPQSPVPSPQSPYTADGFSVNSGQFSGMPTAEAKQRITDWLEEKGIGKKAVNYKLRDWIFSRQRYWGEPIPIVHCERCGIVPLPESALPLKLPDVKSYAPTGTGESPLAGIAEWVNTTCPQCGGPAKRETNTMPQWAGSCWYYIRYLDPSNDTAFAAKDKIDYWLPVDLYVGGAEHAVLHLLYSRFWHKVLYDCGLVNTVEPFQRLINQGMILGEDNQKMSKSRGNVINPDDIIREYGADALRLYEMFLGPLEVSKPWITAGLAGVSRFLERLWAIGDKPLCEAQSPVPSPQSPDTERLTRLLHKTIKKVSEDTSSLDFNTAISAMMIYSNELAKLAVIPRAFWEPLVIMSSAYAPHLGEELWEKLGHTGSVSACTWPAYDDRLTVDDEVTIVAQVNGKIRDKFTAAAGTATAELEKTALALPGVIKWLEGHTVVKVIAVPDKLVNIVVKTHH